MPYTVLILREKEGKTITESARDYPSRAAAARATVGLGSRRIVRDRVNNTYRVYL